MRIGQDPRSRSVCQKKRPAQILRCAQAYGNIFNQAVFVVFSFHRVFGGGERIR